MFLQLEEHFAEQDVFMESNLNDTLLLDICYKLHVHMNTFLWEYLYRDGVKKSHGL